MQGSAVPLSEHVQLRLLYILVVAFLQASPFRPNFGCCRFDAQAEGSAVAAPLLMAAASDWPSRLPQAPTALQTVPHLCRCGLSHPPRP